MQIKVKKKLTEIVNICCSDMMLNCQSANNGNMNGSVSSSTGHQSLQNLDSIGTNLAISPISAMGMSPVGMNSCSPIVMSPMGSHHHGYATPVTPSPVHSTHHHNGGLSPINDVKTHFYGRYDGGKYCCTFFVLCTKKKKLLNTHFFALIVVTVATAT